LPKNAMALAVSSYGVAKQQNFLQSGTGTPTAYSSSGFTFQAFIELCSSAGLTNASLQLPSLTVTNFPIFQEFSGFEVDSHETAGQRVVSDVFDVVASRSRTRTLD